MKIGKNTGLYLGLAAKAFGSTQLGDLALTAHKLKNKSGNGNGDGNKPKKPENTGPNDNGADTTPPTAPKKIGKFSTGDFDLNQNYWQN